MAISMPDDVRTALYHALLDRELECRTQAHERHAAGRSEAECVESRLKARWYKKLARDVRRGKL